jgi:fido (protein-threonine AMPylation protein)
MADSASNPPHVWEQVQRLGINPNVTSYAEYEESCAHGALAAEKFVSEYRPDLFSPETSRVVHRLMFHRVHPWAGQFRKGGEAVIIAGYPAADSWRVQAELELLQLQISRWRDYVAALALEDIHVTASLCAFHHIRFERVHPFRDGNGRVGRIILAAAMSRLFERPIAFDWRKEKQTYYTALLAGNKGRLTPLVNLLIAAVDLPLVARELPAPFRMAPRMFEEMATIPLEDDFQWSIRR